MTHQEVGKRARHSRNVLLGKKITQPFVPRSMLKQLTELSTSVMLSNFDPTEISLFFLISKIFWDRSYSHNVQRAPEGESHLV